MGFQSTKLMAPLLVFLLVLGAANAHAANKKGLVQVYDSAQLQQAMQPANAGKQILVHAGEYEVSQTLIVPEGATLRGESQMRYDHGYPEGISRKSGTILKATTGLLGDMVMMGHGSTVEKLLIRDIDAGPGGVCTTEEISTCAVTPDRARCCPRNRGNLILVASRGPNDRVSATVDECELDNPNFSGIAPNGPNGRGIAVITRNLNLGNEPAADSRSTLKTTMTRTLVHAGRGGSAIFAINFADRSNIDLFLYKNKFEGGLDANGGVSRPDAVHHSSTSITSIENLYRPTVPGSILGWTITGGSGAPIPFPGNVSTDYNSLDMFSLNDRIEDCFAGVVAAGAQRFFNDAAGVGPSSHNNLDLQMYGTEFLNNVYSDFYLVAAVSVDDFPTGDFNTLRAIILGVSGDDSSNNLYADTAYGAEDLPLSPENVGVGTELQILGSLPIFLFTNSGLGESPPSADVFVKRFR